MFTKNIAKALFLSLEVGNVLIDPREALKPGPRVAAEPVRTELYQKAVRVALGPISSEDLYRHTLKLGNQNSVNHLNPQKRKKLNDCVDPPTQSKLPTSKECVRRKGSSCSGNSQTIKKVSEITDSDFFHYQFYSFATFKTVKGQISSFKAFDDLHFKTFLVFYKKSLHFCVGAKETGRSKLSIAQRLGLPLLFSQ